MSKYASRILAVDRGSFTPLIYTTFGGWGPQATAYHKKLTSLLAKKRNEEYSHVMNYIRTRIRFSLLRSVLVAVRGSGARNLVCQTQYHQFPSIWFQKLCTLKVPKKWQQQNELSQLLFLKNVLATPSFKRREFFYQIFLLCFILCSAYNAWVIRQPMYYLRDSGGYKKK